MRPSRSQSLTRTSDPRTTCLRTAWSTAASASGSPRRASSVSVGTTATSPTSLVARTALSIASCVPMAWLV